MKPKLLILGLCAFLTGVLLLILLRGNNQPPQTRLEIAPDGTIAVPRNDNTRIIAHFDSKTNPPPSSRP